MCEKPETKSNQFNVFWKVELPPNSFPAHWVVIIMAIEVQVREVFLQEPRETKFVLEIHHVANGFRKECQLARIGEGNLIGMKSQSMEMRRKVPNELFWFNLAQLNGKKLNCLWELLKVVFFWVKVQEFEMCRQSFERHRTAGFEIEGSESWREKFVIF
jgi:hypothetical protein